jgi:hypothetical protein
MTEATTKDVKSEVEQPQRYAPEATQQELSAKVIEAREKVGRPTLAAHVSTALKRTITQSAIWRWENGRIQSDEVATVKSAVSTFASLKVTKQQSRKARLAAAVTLVQSLKVEDKVKQELLDLLA